MTSENAAWLARDAAAERATADRREHALAAGLPGERVRVALLAGCAVLLLGAYLFLFFVVPQTHARLQKPSAALAHHLGLWRAVRALPLPDLHGTALAVALAGTVVAAFAAYLVAVLLARTLARTGALLGVVVGAAAVFTAASALALPNLDTDVYTYIGTGRVAAVYHRDPYAHATDRFPQDPYLQYASPQHTHYPDVKLPAWMPIDVGLAWVAGDDPATGLLVYRAALAAFSLGCLALVLLIVRRLRRTRLVEAAIAWGWNPLTVLFAQSKVDSVMVFFLLAAALLLVRGRRTASLASLTVSALIKLLSAPYLVLLWLQELRAGRRRELALGTALILGIAAALYAPYSHPLRLVAYHLGLAGQGGSGDAQSHSPLRTLPALAVVVLVAAVGLRRIWPPAAELLRLWALVALVVGAVTLPAEYPWYLLTLVALVSIAGELRLTAAAAALGCLGLAVYERRSNSTPTARLPGGSLFSPTTALAAGLLVVLAALGWELILRSRRRTVEARP